MLSFILAGVDRDSRWWNILPPRRWTRTDNLLESSSRASSIAQRPGDRRRMCMIHRSPLWDSPSFSSDHDANWVISLNLLQVETSLIYVVPKLRKTGSVSTGSDFSTQRYIQYLVPSSQWIICCTINLCILTIIRDEIRALSFYLTCTTSFYHT